MKRERQSRQGEKDRQTERKNKRDNNTAQTEREKWKNIIFLETQEQSGLVNTDDKYQHSSKHR